MRKGSRSQHQTGSFTAVFDRIVEKSNARGDKSIVHVKDVRDLDGMLVSRHQKFDYDADFRALGDLEKGDKLAFDANMQELGQSGGKPPKFGTKQAAEYRLSDPSKVRKEG